MVKFCVGESYKMADLIKKNYGNDAQFFFYMAVIEIKVTSLDVRVLKLL